MEDRKVTNDLEMMSTRNQISKILLSFSPAVGGVSVSYQLLHLQNYFYLS